MPFLAAIPAALGSAMGAVGSGLGAAAGAAGGALGEGGLGTLEQLGLGAAKGLTGGLKQQTAMQSQQHPFPQMAFNNNNMGAMPTTTTPTNQDYLNWLLSGSSNQILDTSPKDMAGGDSFGTSARS